MSGQPDAATVERLLKALGPWRFRRNEDGSIGITHEVNADEVSHYEIRPDNPTIAGTVLYRLASALA